LRNANPAQTRLQEEQYEVTVPTVGDRVAQTVVARVLEERAERIFHRDSYGYRPGRGALDAVAACRERCWQYDWVVEFDICSFLDAWSHCSFADCAGLEQLVLGGW
jgi:retron-type reverse transcriptase